MQARNDCGVDGGHMTWGVTVGIVWVKSNNCATNLKNRSNTVAVLFVLLSTVK